MVVICSNRVEAISDIWIQELEFAFLEDVYGFSFDEPRQGDIEYFIWLKNFSFIFTHRLFINHVLVTK